MGRWALGAAPVSCPHGPVTASFFLFVFALPAFFPSPLDCMLRRGGCTATHTARGPEWGSLGRRCWGSACWRNQGRWAEPSGTELGFCHLHRSHSGRPFPSRDSSWENPCLPGSPRHRAESPGGEGDRSSRGFLPPSDQVRDQRTDDMTRELVG